MEILLLVGSETVWKDKSSYKNVGKSYFQSNILLLTSDVGSTNILLKFSNFLAACFFG